jgi:hypothetical protein
MNNINEGSNNEPSREEGKPPEDDKEKFNPKSKPGEKWDVDGLEESNTGNQQGFKPSHYQRAIKQILNDLFNENPKGAYSIRELKPRIAYVFDHNQIKLKVNRKSIESALAELFKDNVITAIKDWRKYPTKGWRVVLCYRMATVSDVARKYERYIERINKDIKKTRDFMRENGITP